MTFRSRPLGLTIRGAATAALLIVTHRTAYGLGHQDGYADGYLQGHVSAVRIVLDRYRTKRAADAARRN